MADSEYIEWESSREAEERKAKEAEEGARLVGAVEGLARTRDGVHFLAWLMAQTCFLCGVPVLPHESMAYLEGQRSVGSKLWPLIQKAHAVEAVCAEEDI